MFINTPALSKLICFAETKVGRPENMSVSGSGLCEGSIYIFCPFLWFVSFGQAKEMNKNSLRQSQIFTSLIELSIRGSRTNVCRLAD